MWSYESYKKQKYKENLLEDIQKVKVLQQQYEVLSDEQIKLKTLKFKEDIKNGETLDNLLCEAFALAMECIRRIKGFKLHDTQIMGAMILHGYKLDSNCLAEMKTGEGKTLVAVLSAYLNALTGKGVHIITSNDYLARRDQEENKEIFELLGLSSDCITSDTFRNVKKEKYKSDIVYASTYEIAFDYLKDNSVLSIEDKVLNCFNYLIIDEVDDVLMEQSMTPMVISGKSNSDYTNPDFLILVDEFVSNLSYVKTDEQRRENYYRGYKDNYDVSISNLGMGMVANLEELGIKKQEEFYNKVIKFRFPSITYELFQIAVNQALQANFILNRGNDYTIKLEETGIEIDIINKNTGRKMIGQSYSGGLSQAVQAHEARLIIKDPNYTEQDKINAKKIMQLSNTDASITFANFLKLYNKFSGMSGTLLTAEEELEDLYGVEVIDVPPKTMSRVDNPLEAYETSNEKLKRILSLVKYYHTRGQPILLGTLSISESNNIASKIEKELEYSVEIVNAETEDENNIIKSAGKKGSIVVATNMAGRGTNIKLDEETKALGGLCVIGTSLNESRRIDNQLRGRSGRQGDPGVTYILTSFEDKMYQPYASQLKKVYKGNSFNRELFKEEALKIQSGIESKHWSQRKNNIDFESLIDLYRKVYYELRDYILETNSLKDVILKVYKLTNDREILNYLNSINKIEELDLGTDSILLKQIKKKIKTMDEMWGAFLDDSTHITETIYNCILFDQNGEIIYKFIDKMSQKMNEFSSEIQNLIIDTKFKETINKTIAKVEKTDVVSNKKNI